MDPPIFAENDGGPGIMMSEIFKHFVHLFGGWHKMRGTQQFSQRYFCQVNLVAMNAQEILRMEKSDNVVRIQMHHRHAWMTQAAKLLDHFRHGHLGIQKLHGRTGCHDMVNLSLRSLEHVIDQDALGGIDDTGGLAFFHQCAKFVQM